jgi:hypothetical protein
LIDCTKAEAPEGRFVPGFVGVVKEAGGSVNERLVGCKRFRMWEGVGSERWRHGLRKGRILAKEERVRKETKTAEMVNGKGEEGNVFLVYGGDDLLIRKGAMGSTAESAADTGKVSLKDIGWIGQLRLTRQMRQDRGGGDVDDKEGRFGISG